MVAAVAAGAGVAVALADPRRAAELARPDDQRFIEQPAVRQIIQQGRKRLVGGRHQPRLEIAEIAAVRVPIDATRS